MSHDGSGERMLRTGFDGGEMTSVEMTNAHGQVITSSTKP